MNWKPIETAPKDEENRFGQSLYGPEILLVRSGCEVCFGYWVHLVRMMCWGAVPNYGRLGGWFLCNSDKRPPSGKEWHEYLETSQYEPTHWMPLPEPPQTGET